MWWGFGENCDRSDPQPQKFVVVCCSSWTTHKLRIEYELSSVREVSAKFFWGWSIKAKTHPDTLLWLTGEWRRAREKSLRPAAIRPILQSRLAMALHKNGRMKEKFVGGLLAVLLVPVVGTASSCHAQATSAGKQNSQASKQVISTQPSPQLNATRVEAQKVGQYQYQARADIDRDSIAKNSAPRLRRATSSDSLRAKHSSHHISERQSGNKHQNLRNWRQQSRC